MESTEMAGAGRVGARTVQRVALAAAMLVLLGGFTLLATRSGIADTCSAHDESDGDGEVALDGVPEQLVQDEAEAVGDRFAGAVWRSDGTVAFCVTGGPVSDALRNNPKIKVVRVRFSDDRLEAAMDEVAIRLNALLAPDDKPMPSGAWPWASHIDVEDNVVRVQVDPSQKPKDRAIRAALADELDARTVVLTYEPIPIVVQPVKIIED